MTWASTRTRTIAACVALGLFGVGCSSDEKPARLKPRASSSSASSRASSSAPPAEKPSAPSEAAPLRVPHPELLTVVMKPSSDFGAAAQDLTITTPDGHTILGLVGAPPSDMRGCMLIQHGLNSSAKDVVAVGLLAEASGFRALAIDAQWSPNTPTNPASKLSTPEALAKQMSGTISDLQTAMDWFGAQPGCNPNHIGYIGISFGGITGASMMRLDSRITAPVFVVAGADFRTIFSSSSVTEFQDWSKTDLDGAVAAFAQLEAGDGVREALTDTPILMLNGTRDDVITPDAAKNLHAAAGAHGTVQWFDGGHGIGDLVQLLTLTSSLGTWAGQHGALLAPSAR